MTLAELKSLVTNKTPPTDFMIFLCKDGRFLADMYIAEIANCYAGKINKISSINEPKNYALYLLTDQEASLNILYTDIFEERAENYSEYTRTIVVCNKIDKVIDPVVQDFIIEMPKLLDWQIQDYIKLKYPTLEDKEITWLIEAADKDIYRIMNELAKLDNFTGSEQLDVFHSLQFDINTDLYQLDLFEIVNALVEGNLLTLSMKYLLRRDYTTLEPVVLVNRALSSLKNIVLITQNPQLTADDLGVSSKQLNTVRSKFRNLNILAAKQKIKFLTNIDVLLKTSRLELSNEDFINYLVTHMAYKITL